MELSCRVVEISRSGWYQMVSDDLKSLMLELEE